MIRSRSAAATGAVHLPLGPAPVSSYLFLAYPLAILAGAGSGPAWLYQRFIHTYLVPGRDLKVLTHAGATSTRMSDVYDAGFPRLRLHPLDPRRLHVEPLPFLRACLGREIYPQVDVDYHHLEDGCDPWLHELLLTGVDAGGATFTALAFDRCGRLRQRSIPAAALAAALQVDGPKLLAAMERQGRHVPDWLQADWGGRPRWILYRLVEEKESPPSTARIVADLATYLAALPPLTDGAARLPALTTWGIGAQHALARRLHAGEMKAPQISLRLWWEHKRVMAARLHWLVTRGVCAPQEAEGAADLARRAGQLRLVALRHQRDARLHPAARRDLADGIEDLAERERHLLQRCGSGSGDLPAPADRPATVSAGDGGQARPARDGRSRP